MHRLFPLLLLAVLAACASNKPAPVVDRGSAAAPSAASTGSHIVKRGDTLYSIAREAGVDPQQLMSWNQLSDARLSPGQVLRTRPPAGTNTNTSAPASTVATSTIDTAVIEAKPLGPPGGMSAPVAAPAPVPAAPAPGGIKTQPMGMKLPYSEQNLALLQRAENVAPPKTETPPPAPAPASKPVPESAPAPAADLNNTVSKDGVEWSWPAAGAVVAPFGEGGGKGVEIGGKAGDPVYAAASGKVTYSGAGIRGYGNLIIITHNSKYLSAYAHNKTLLVKQGQSVKRGQKIAEMGAVDAEASKLHFEIRSMGQPVDPAGYLPARAEN